MAKNQEVPRLAIIEQDPWLEPVQEAIYARYNRFISREQDINKQFGSLKQFALAYQYFGIHFDKKMHGFIANGLLQPKDYF